MKMKTAADGDDDNNALLIFRMKSFYSFPPTFLVSFLELHNHLEFSTTRPVPPPLTLQISTTSSAAVVQLRKRIFLEQVMYKSRLCCLLLFFLPLSLLELLFAKPSVFSVCYYYAVAHFKLLAHSSQEKEETMLLRKMEKRFGERRSGSLLVWSVMVVCRDDEMQSTKDKKGKAAGHFVDIVR